jgi:hypothetical protein
MLRSFAEGIAADRPRRNGGDPGIASVTRYFVRNPPTPATLARRD